MIDEIFDKISLVKTMTFSLSNCNKEIGQYPDELKNFADILHCQILELEDLLEKTIKRILKMTENEHLKNALLTEQQENLDLIKEIEKLKKANEKLLKDIHNLKFGYKMSSYRGDKFCDEVNKLKEEIEKMKCCGNCRHYNEGDCQSEHTYDCKYWNAKNINDFWELKK